VLRQSYNIGIGYIPLFIDNFKFIGYISLFIGIVAAYAVSQYNGVFVGLVWGMFVRLCLSHSEVKRYLLIFSYLFFRMRKLGCAVPLQSFVSLRTQTKSGRGHCREYILKL
jgi:hypothetical protein